MVQQMGNGGLYEKSRKINRSREIIKLRKSKAMIQAQWIIRIPCRKVTDHNPCVWARGLPLVEKNRTRRYYQNVNVKKKAGHLGKLPLRSTSGDFGLDSFFAGGDNPNLSHRRDFGTRVCPKQGWAIAKIIRATGEHL
jgi:hypothetical protein